MFDAPHSFFYKKWRTLAADFALVCIVPTASFLLVFTFFLYRGSDALEAKILSAIFFVILVPACFLGRASRASVQVNSESIRWRFWGRDWKDMKWRDIKAVVVWTAPSSLGSVTAYGFYTSESCAFTHSWGKRMFFDNTIENADRLLELVNKNIAEFKIPVFDRIGKAGAVKPRKELLS